ncbi:putative ribonuclease H-like domain-containing protein [Tanacetum coccineum]
MSQPANDDFSQHLSDDEASYHEDASDNDVWKVIQNGNSKKRILTGKDGVVRVLPPVSTEEIHALEAHGAEVSTEDANHKFLRCLPPAWSNLAMTMRTKPDVDTLSIDDLYNNLRVFEQELTITYTIYTFTTKFPEREVPAGFADKVIYSLFSKQSEDLDLLHEDLEQIDDVDIEEMDINWQIAMIAIRMKKFKQEYWKGGGECTSKEQHDGEERETLIYQDQGAGKKEQNQNCLLTMDDGGPQKPETNVLDDKFSKNSITSSEEVVSEPKPKEVEPSCVTHVKTPRQPMKNQGTPKVKGKNWNEMRIMRTSRSYTFHRRKVVLFCGILRSLDRDRDIYEKKMAKRRAQEIKCKIARPNSNYNSGSNFVRTDHPLKNMEDRGIFDSGCSGHMTGNKDHLDDFEECKGGSVTFGGSKGYITGKGRIRVGNLDFDSVSFVKELGHFNLFSISQICDKQHKVLFTETECLVVSPDFKMPDENQILLKVPRQHNMYSFDMKTPSLTKDYACLIAKATSDESKLWHRRLGHINFKNLNKLVKGNLVRGLPSKVFRNNHTCVACQKGKQHKASCKAKLERTITEPLHTLHMDLFGPTSVKSINHASYCLVITDDCTRFSWVFFLATKDETSGILQNFIRQIENQLNHMVKIIRSDNGTEFKNRDMLEFCGNKGIKQEYSNARTPQQNRVAERMNMTLIEAARTMLADSLLPTTFWAEAVSTACYIFNRVRVTKPQNKTPYELLFGHKPINIYTRPFGCYVTILDTLSVLGKFDGKCDEGFLVGYSLNSKAYRVYNLVTKRVEVNLHVNFLEDKPNVKGVGYRWMFDIDYLTDSMNYIPVSLENQANPHAELIVVPSAVKNTKEKVESRKSSTNSKKEEILTEPQQEKEASSTDTSEDNPKILAFRRELEEIALKHRSSTQEQVDRGRLIVGAHAHDRFSWVFFLASKDETSGILQNFIRQIENQLNHRVKIIRSDNGTEFKNRDMLEFCGNKGIKQEYSNARTPQQNGVAERMNRTLIEAARTMLADSLLPTTFWAEAVSTACYIFNRVRVTKPQNKTPYELFFVDGKSDEGFLVGYSLNSKAYRVYNLVTKRVEVNLHVNFLEDKPNVKGVGYRWMFDIDYLTDSMNYIPVSLENQANPHAAIVVPSAVKNTEEKVKTRKSSTHVTENEEILTEPPQRMWRLLSTDTSED